MIMSSSIPFPSPWVIRPKGYLEPATDCLPFTGLDPFVSRAHRCSHLCRARLQLAGLQGPLGLRGGASLSFDPVGVSIHLQGLLSTRPARYRDSTAMCSPLTRVTQYRPTTRNITANTSPHCQATGFTSSFLREISLKKGKIIKNQWNSNVRQSTVWTERGRQAFHHQQLPAKQLQTSLWNAP